MNGLGVDLSRYGTSLEETRKLVEALKQRRRERPEAVTPVTPSVFGKEDIGQYGAEWDALLGELREGWTVKGDELAITYLSPTGEEAAGFYEGVPVSREEMERRETYFLERPGKYPGPPKYEYRPAPELQAAIGDVFPERDVAEVLAYAEAQPEAFLNDILDIGRTPETEAFLEGLGASDEEMDTIFAPLLITTPVAKRRLGDIQTYYEHLARGEEAQDTALIERAQASIHRELDSIYKEGRTDENVALLRFMGFTDAEMGEFFVTPEEVTKRIVEELYVPESKMKDIWDAFHLGAQRMWYQSKQYFVSALPEWVLGAVEPPEEGFPGRLWSQESRDAFKDRFSQIYLEQDEKYAEWLLAHPELSPRPEWVGGVIENVKKDPSLIRDPAYWGYIAAESGAFMLAVIGTTLTVGAATRNPWLALSAGVAVATPSQSQDLYEDLIMSGATPEQAAGLSIPVGVAISMVEVAGDLPFLRAMSPAFKRLLHKNVTTAIVQGATQSALRRGFTTIGRIEAAEILEEIAQGAIQDATVKTVDENREILADVSDIAIRTAIATVPLALIGGANVARVTHRLNLEQRNNFNETRDRFLKEGLSDYEATQRALADLYLTPEGQRVIEEVTEEMELAAKQKAELAKLPIEPPATFEPDIVPIVEPVEMTLPSTEGMINASIEPNLAKTLLRATAELPGGKSIVRAIDPRALVPHAPETIADAVDKNAIAWREIVKAGQGVSAIKLGSLQAMTTNPIKLFGFNKNAYSGMMVARLLPEYKGTVEAGTLEHVFIHPEMYDWTRLRKGLEYVTRTHKIYGDVLWLLRKEGVAPEHVTEGWWIHRVVEGKYDANNELVEVRGRPGMKGRFAAKRAYEMHRKAPTMYEGMVWEIKYAANPTLGVSTFIEEAYRKIANARFYEAVDKDLDAMGKAGQLPVDILKERYPEIAERAEVMAERSKDLGNFHKVVSRAIRGEIPPTQTLQAIEARFPELGRRFKALVEKPVTAEKELRTLLTQSQKVIRDLQAQLKAKKLDIEAIRAQPMEALPDEAKLTAAFRLMDYEDRVAFHSTMENQTEEMATILSEEEAEMAGIEETLEADPVATARFMIGKRRVGLTSFISIKEQTFPEYFTVKQAQALFVGRPFTKYTQKGLPEFNRVPKDEALDDLTTRFNLTPDEIADRVMAIREQRQTLEDLRGLVQIADTRLKGIKRMLEVLDGVDTKSEFIPKAEAGMPEAGLQQDIFGYQHPVFPKGKGEVTQISMDEYNRLTELRKEAGLEGPPPNIVIKPQIEGVKGLEGEPEFAKVVYEVPAIKSVAERKAGLEALRKQVKEMAEAHKPEYWRAKYERAAKMEIVAQPEIGKGRVLGSHFGGKIYDQEFIDAVNKFMGHDAGIKLLRYTSNAAGILRVTKAAFDFSFMGIQGLPAIGLAYSYMLTNPKQGTKMMAECIKAITYPVRAVFDPAWMFKYLTKLEPQALQRDSFGGSSVAVDFFEQAKRLGGPYPRFELAFFGAGEMIRNPFWGAMEKEAVRTGNEFQLARFLDRLTGIISTEAMGVATTTRQLESSFIWFAPRYTRACLTLLSNTFRGGYTGAQARRALGGMVMAGVLMFSVTRFGLSKLEGKDDEEAWKDILEGFGVVQDPITGEWDWKPSARMMTFKIGNYHFGIGGFWYGLLRLAGNIMATIEQVGDKERIDLVRIMKYGSLNRRDNPFIAWWFSRSSPLTGLSFQVGWPLLKSTLSGELQGGRDFFGYPIETWQEYATDAIIRFEPIWLEQALNPYIPWAAKDYEVPEGVAKVAVPVLEIFGWRSFPEYGWARFYNKLNEVLPHLHEDVLREYFTDEEMVKILEAQEKGELGYAQLPRALRQRLLGMYPELKELYEQALADNALRNSPPWKQWDAQVKAERTSYYGRGDNLIEQLSAGEIDTRELRERWSEAGSTYGSALDTIEDTPFYKQIFDYWEKREAQGVKYDMFFFLAENEYDEVMFAEYLDYKGDLDWDARDEAVDAYIEKWGVDVYEAIREGFAARKIGAGLSPALVRLSEDKDKLGRGYWRLPYKPIMEMDEDDEVENNIPAEFSALWEQYQALETDEEREAFTEANPDMAKDWRAEYRLAHPEDDARLAMWGYGGKLQSKEAYDFVAQWSKELGIPLEQMGLGLPPRVLIEDYFTYNKTEGVTERKWFRQEHSEFETWGQEAYGWKPIDEQSVTPRNIDKLLQRYNEVEESKARLVFRHEHPELETWLVEEKDYTPVGDRWKGGTEIGEVDIQNRSLSILERHRIFHINPLREGGKSGNKPSQAELERLMDYYDMTPNARAMVENTAWREGPGQAGPYGGLWDEATNTIFIPPETDLPSQVIPCLLHELGEWAWRQLSDVERQGYFDAFVAETDGKIRELYKHFGQPTKVDRDNFSELYALVFNLLNWDEIPKSLLPFYHPITKKK